MNEPLLLQEAKCREEWKDSVHCKSQSLNIEKFNYLLKEQTTEKHIPYISLKIYTEKLFLAVRNRKRKSVMIQQALIQVRW
jgi:hypothetical protein